MWQGPSACPYFSASVLLAAAILSNGIATMSSGLTIPMNLRQNVNLRNDRKRIEKCFAALIDCDDTSLCIFYQFAVSRSDADALV